MRLSEQPELITKERQVNSIEARLSAAQNSSCNFCFRGFQVGWRVRWRRLDENPEEMRQRRETVEHPFGTIKARMGATHFLMRPCRGLPPRWRCMCWPTT